MNITNLYCESMFKTYKDRDIPTIELEKSDIVLLKDVVNNRDFYYSIKNKLSYCNKTYTLTKLIDLKINAWETKIAIIDLTNNKEGVKRRYKNTIIRYISDNMNLKEKWKNGL